MQYTCLMLADLVSRESKIASWLGLPHVPDMDGCSWADLGLVSVQKYINDNAAAVAAFNLSQGNGTVPLCELPSPPPLEGPFYTEMPGLMTATPLSSTSGVFDAALSNIRSSSAIRHGTMATQLQFPSEILSRSRTEPPWPSSSHPRKTSVDEEPHAGTCEKANARKQDMALRHDHGQLPVALAQVGRHGHQERVLESASGTKRADSVVETHNTHVPLGSFANGCFGDGHPALTFGRPYSPYVQVEVIRNPQHSPPL